ncbi:acetyl-CoA carboxylase biotin carboxylase subunit [Limnochorda pilosa]|uniref:biotin carboxylase n=1 Tax=Limnochorda pilosa TaxID=1555112 RepID=A0A0K2SPK4_LIMPI|nr:biotin carboxylase N-terminal domain-containing protein [Limnochorda pilosa]BAS29031.1 biotin carboxylase [Limnochorda pilosa]
MFARVLIANRGEIACRIIDTCRRMGIETVAVHSDADAGSRHVRMADRAYPIGPAPVTQSYLNVERLLEAARASGAEAVHPGYGLLSEQARFARSVLGAGLTWIGPQPEVMEEMADKLAARRRMEAAGLPVVPASGPLASAGEAMEAAASLGYPVMLKAVAGGGGIGMERVGEPAALAPAFERARSRAQAYFGDGTVYLERLLERPRHVEIQVLGDHHGHVIHLGGRDCSLQRRHQKVIEEAPPPELAPDLARALEEAALRAVRELGYRNSGTLEFLVEGGRFAFLEMNTRLQVEHPVTEAITGVDLVEQQLRVAAGEPLALTQDQVAPRGHAVEARLYAEDPERFLPRPGTVTGLSWPRGEGVRVDHGLVEGYGVTPYYDPLLAKIVAWGKSRAEAIERLVGALQETRVDGLVTNREALLRVLTHTRFRAGAVDTALFESVGGRGER